MSLRAGYWSWIGGVVAAAGLVLASARPAEADSIHAVGFTAGSQAFWGPGKSAASLDEGASHPSGCSAAGSASASTWTQVPAR